MAAVEYQKIGKQYGSVAVMDDVSFSIDEKKFVVLLGPSGCGKTTLLRMTAGLEKVTRGDILFSGERINDLPSSRSRHRDGLPILCPVSADDGVRQHRLQSAGAQGAEVGHRTARAGSGRSILDLAPYLDRYPRALSGGQRQRVAMGRALVRHPKVFLFDEPLSNLDAKLRAQMRFEIRRIHDRLDTTTIYVTHDQIEAMTMADEIVVMRHGVIEQIGAPEAVYDKPVNRFVADFIGSPAINFLDGEVVFDDGRPQVDVGGQRLPVPAGSEPVAGQAVTLGLRPLDIQLRATGSSMSQHTSDQVARHGAHAEPVRPEHWVPATIDFLESTGAESHVHLLFGGHTIKAVSPTRLKYKRGDTLEFGLDTVRLHLFDRESEQRI